MNGRSRIIGAIQAGGRSSRMHSDKAWLELFGRTLIECVIAAAAPVADSLAVVIDPATTHRERYKVLCQRWDALLLDDLHPGEGPLAGIETALNLCDESGGILALACDLPHITSELLEFLRQEAELHGSEIIVPCDRSGRLQPLVALYPAACLGEVRRLLSAGRRRVDLLFECFPTRVIDFSEIEHINASDLLFTNLNTPGDYATACKQWET